MDASFERQARSLVVAIFKSRGLYNPRFDTKAWMRFMRQYRLKRDELLSTDEVADLHADLTGLPVATGGRLPASCILVDTLSKTAISYLTPVAEIACPDFKASHWLAYDLNKVPTGVIIGCLVDELEVWLFSRTEEGWRVALHVVKKPTLTRTQKRRKQREQAAKTRS